MARLWHTGIELNSINNGVEFQTNNGDSNPSSSPRTATNSILVNAQSAVVAGFLQQFASAAGNGPYFIRAYVRITTQPASESRILALTNNASFSTPGAQLVYVTLDNSGVLRLYDEDGQITGTTTLSLTTYYRIEVKVDVSPASGSHVVELQVDGSVVATASNRALSTGIESLLVGINLNKEAIASGSIRFDDIAVNDSTGSFQTGYPGAGGINHYKPNADGDNHGFLVQTGGTAGAANNFTRVQEVTPNDATDHNADTVLNNTDDYNIANTGAEIGATDVINVVAVGVRFSVAVAGSDSKFVLRIKASSGGTVEESAELAPTSTTWVTNAIANPKNFSLILYDLPGASSTTWTKADLDVAQIGMRISTSNTNLVRISTIWLSVDSTPAAGGSTVVFLGFKSLLGIGN